MKNLRLVLVPGKECTNRKTVSLLVKTLGRAKEIISKRGGALVQGDYDRYKSAIYTDSGSRKHNLI